MSPEGSGRRYALVRNPSFVVHALVRWISPDGHEVAVVDALEAEQEGLDAESVLVVVPPTPPQRDDVAPTLAPILAALERGAIAYVVASDSEEIVLLVPETQLAQAIRLIERRTPDTTVLPERPSAEGLPVVALRDDAIRLGQFLKLADLVDTGAAAKPLLAYGRVRVNGEEEQRRGRRLVPGDVVSVDGRSVVVG